MPPADIEGHVLLVVPVEFHEHIPNVNTKVGEKSPAIRVNVADLSAPGGPATYRGALWFNALLHGGLRRQLGETILGQMSKGQANPGKNPPWQLTDMLGNADWVAFAENWLKTPEGIVFETEAQASVVKPGEAQALAGAVAPPPPPAAPPAPVAAPPVNAPAPAPAVAPPPAAAPSVPAPAANMADALAALPEEERNRMLAILAANQAGQAAH